MKPILLDGKMSSSLDFRAGRLQALAGIAKGEKILWELNLGLFSELTFPFGHETEAKAMQLAIDHFLATLWVEFKDYTIGLSLYRGDLNFDPLVFSDFMKFLTLNVPDALTLYLHFENGTLPPLEAYRRSSRALFPRFDVRLNGVSLKKEGAVGFLLPSNGDTFYENLLNEGVEPRILTEEFLSAEWEGLDLLYVDTEHLSKEGLRKVQGFQAAGGEIVVIPQSN